MSVVLTLGPRETLIECRSSRVLRLLDRRTSYPVEGAWFSKSFRAGRWDGKIHLIRIQKHRGYTVPTGLLPTVLRVLDETGERVHFQSNASQRVSSQNPRSGLDPGGSSPPLPPHDWRAEKRPRRYQRQAVKAFVQSRPISGFGTLRMPIRSGKTFTAALVIERLGVRTLFVVPSLLLLHQTVDVLRSCFGGLTIGEFGGGLDTVGDITVATYQSLMAGFKRSDPDTIALLSNVGLLIVDELHHAEAEEWRKPLFACDARYRLGLSATIYVSRKNPNEQSAIWLTALCGPVVFEVTMDYLVRKGWLVKTKVALHVINQPEHNGRWSAKTYTHCIAHNHIRNGKIIEEALKARDKDQRCLIDIGRIAHGRMLLVLLRAAGLKAALMTGSTPESEREVIVRRLTEHKIDTLVSTLLGEGVDIPSLEVVINAEGGKARKSTIQRLRNMTPADGKTGALVVDFVDLMNPYLAEHSRQRLRAYKKERCFDIEVRKDNA